MFQFVNTGLDETVLKSLNAVTPDEDLCKSMNRQGMVQKEVQVKGKHGTFTRKQWVRASDVQSSGETHSGFPVDISKFSFKNYRNPDGRNMPGRETFRETLESVSKETEQKAKTVLNSYSGNMTPYKQLSIEFQHINNHSSYRDMIEPSSEQGLKDAKAAILKRQQELLEQSKQYTKWDEKQKCWVKDEGTQKVTNSQSQYKNGHIEDNGDFIVDDKSDLGDFVEEVTGKDMFELRDAAIDELEKEPKYKLLDMESMDIDSASKNKDGSISVTAHVEGFLTDGDDFDRYVTFKVPSKQSQKKTSSQPAKKDSKQSTQSQKDSSKQEVSFDLPSGKTTKQAVAELLSSHSKADIMSAAKSAGITWKENDHEGINWMRASMAIQKHMSGGTHSSTNKSSTKN